MIAKAAKVVIAGALLVYPLAIYFADSYLTPNQLLAGLLALLALRSLLAAWFVRRGVIRPMVAATLLMLGAVLALTLLPPLHVRWLRFYPALFDFAAFAVFFGSLLTRRPLVERIARVFNGNLPSEGVIYTRRVTQAWSALLLGIALLSCYTAVGTSFRFWSLYNGVIVYFIMGAAFICEYALRLHMKRKWVAA